MRRICMIASLASFTLSRIRLASSNCSRRSASLTVKNGCFFTVIGCVRARPSTVSRAWYVPGSAVGPFVVAPQSTMPWKGVTGAYCRSQLKRVTPAAIDVVTGPRPRPPPSSSSGGGSAWAVVDLEGQLLRRLLQPVGDARGTRGSNRIARLEEVRVGGGRRRRSVLTQRTDFVEHVKAAAVRRDR